MACFRTFQTSAVRATFHNSTLSAGDKRMFIPFFTGEENNDKSRKAAVMQKSGGGDKG